MAELGLVPKWRCGCRLPLAPRQKVGLLSRHSMISGMPNSAEKNFESESSRLRFFLSSQVFVDVRSRSESCELIITKLTYIKQFVLCPTNLRVKRLRVP